MAYCGQRQVATEHFKHGDLIRALVLDINVGRAALSIRLSRSHLTSCANLLQPGSEIGVGVVEIVSLAREAGASFEGCSVVQ